MWLLQREITGALTVRKLAEPFAAPDRGGRQHLRSSTSHQPPRQVSFALGLMIAIAFEDLAQALRVFLEAHLRGQGLLNVDRAEAVGNMESGFASVLNAFHSLYDSIEKELPNHPVDWYKSPELLVVLAIRNAKHHNKAHKIRNIYNYHVQVCARPQERRKYVLVDFPAGEDGGDTFEFYVSWADLQTFLSLPKKENRLRPEAKAVVESYLHADRFPGYAKKYHVDLASVFVNVVPVIVNAAATIVPTIKGNLRKLSTESEFFMWHFGSTVPADTSKHEVQCRVLALPG
jgi:hypothetical protein